MPPIHPTAPAHPFAEGKPWIPIGFRNSGRWTLTWIGVGSNMLTTVKKIA